MKTIKRIYKVKELDYEICIAIWNSQDLQKIRTNFLTCSNSEVNEVNLSEYGWLHSYNRQFATCLVIADNIKNSDDLIKVMFHEISHTIQRMLDYLNIVCDYRNTEVVACYNSYYMKEWLKICFDFIEKNKELFDK